MPKRPDPAVISVALVHVSPPSDIERGFEVNLDNNESLTRYIDIPMADKCVPGAEEPCLGQTEGQSVSTEVVLLSRSLPEKMGNALPGDVILTPSQLSHQHGSECSNVSPEGTPLSNTPPCSIVNNIFENIDWSPVHCVQIME